MYCHSWPAIGKKCIYRKVRRARRQDLVRPRRDPNGYKSLDSGAKCVANANARGSDRKPLVDGLELEGVKGVGPAVDGGLVGDAVKGGAVAGPEGAGGPLAELLDLALVVARGDRGVEEGRGDVLLDPGDDGGHVVLGVGAGLERVGTAVGGAGDQVELVPVGEGLLSLVVGHVGVHDGADRLPVVDGRGRGDGGVRLAVVVDQLSARGLEGGEVGQGGLQAVEVADHANVHPVDQGVVGDVVQVRQVVEVEQLDELGDVLTTGGGDVELVGASVVVVGGVGVAEVGTDLPREVGTLAVRGVKTVVDGLGNSNVLGGDGAVLLGGGAGLAALSLTLAEAEAERGAGGGSAVVGLADDGGQVEVELAEIGTGDDTVGTAVQRVASSNGGVDDLVEGAGLGEVAGDLLNGGRVDVVDLLLGEAEGRGTGDDTVILLTPALDLTHSLTATVGATLEVGVNLGVVGQGVESRSGGLSDLGELTESSVSESVGSIPVDGAVAVEDLLVVAVVEGVVAGRGGSGGGSVSETAGGVGGQGEASTTGKVPTVLEVAGVGER